MLKLTEDEEQTPRNISGRVLWSWQRKGSEKRFIVPSKENDRLESEYQAYLTNERRGQRVYYCFGDGRPAIINFEKMQTACGSGNCQCFRFRSQGNDRHHMEFKLFRGFMYTVTAHL